jgi:TetR/AcrR family transcriptional regulator, lmrAB and yxaGH operons repressor
MVRQIAERGDIIPRLAEVFRTHGFEGASLSHITLATGLGKGSLYHFFPGGKDEMAAAVLTEIDGWFAANVFVPLRQHEPREAIAAMFSSVDSYFRSGGRVCLVGVFALADTRDRYAQAIAGYFSAWIDALAVALGKLGHADARGLALELVGGIQGALVIARSQNDTAVFTQLLARLEARALQ